MGNHLSTTPRSLQVPIVGLIAEPPNGTPLQPEWLDVVHRDHYSRRRLHKLNPSSDELSTLRDFHLMSTKNSSSFVQEMRDYLGRREMPEHLHIVPESVLDTEADRAIVTPWYRNGNILDFVNKWPVGDGQKLDLIIQIAQGLAYLHGLGVIHGNLYPANILVTDDKDIVLTDAGIYTEVVRLMLSPSGRIPLPQSTVYKSPRELEGDDAPAKSADIYAFASTCYAVLTGRAPFSEIRNPYQRVLKIAHADGHRALQKPLSVSPILWDLLMKCWSPDPTQRPTMDDIVDCLERVKDIANR